MFWFRWKHLIKLTVIVVLCVLCALAFTPSQKTIHLGLARQRAVRALVEPEPTPDVPKITPELWAEELQGLQTRLNGLAVNELTFAKGGDNRINIEIPGLNNPEQAIGLIREAAVLEMRPLTKEQVAHALQQPPDKKFDPYKVAGPPVITGADMSSATAGTDSAGAPSVNFTLNSAGSKKFYEWTSHHIGDPLPIFLDKKLIEAPTIEGAISSQGQIHGGFTTDSAVRLANELSAGSLKVPTKIIEIESVGPTLGAIDLQKSMVASLAGLGIVLLFMLFVYRVPGLLADIALAVYCFLMLAYVALFQVALTLPGIAGFVLSIGMAVDANVLIFERIKEELWAGRTTRAAVGVGFKRACCAVFDSHVTTTVGALVLYWLGTGTVKGFALTLLVGTVFSLLTAVNITRAFMDAVVDNDVVTTPALYGA